MSPESVNGDQFVAVIEEKLREKKSSRSHRSAMAARAEQLRQRVAALWHKGLRWRGYFGEEFWHNGLSLFWSGLNLTANGDLGSNNAPLKRIDRELYGAQGLALLHNCHYWLKNGEEELFGSGSNQFLLDKDRDELFAQKCMLFWSCLLSSLRKGESTSDQLVALSTYEIEKISSSLPEEDKELEAYPVLIRIAFLLILRDRVTSSEYAQFLSWLKGAEEADRAGVTVGAESIQSGRGELAASFTAWLAAINTLELISEAFCATMQSLNDPEAAPSDI